jgi:hypothetical protein
MDLVDLDAERRSERRQPAPALQRREAARHRDRADHRRGRPLERRAREGLAQHAHVEGRVVGDQDAAAQEPRHLREHLLGGGRGVDHRLRDAREPLDAAPERVGDADQRVPLVVQLSAAHEHGPDLGQFAALARQPVGLGIQRDELGGGERLFEHGPGSIPHAPDGATSLAVHYRSPACDASHRSSCSLSWSPPAAAPNARTSCARRSRS